MTPKWPTRTNNNTFRTINNNTNINEDKNSNIKSNYTSISEKAFHGHSNTQAEEEPQKGKGQVT